ncbi:hypothetical protein I6N95_05120 [Vagococcus sp. BWB3-3]|uniref:Uncharacterized protein n=1 Tax=Vagococcus allomyrinae TaxID=2794353 RepID=A0A940SUT9_9ENTE|nr:hypothetical protein [Vagococcus allomyrinae]MBP1040391.1 hypothetical protein [Vagococcus allomyrinae]
MIRQEDLDMIKSQWFKDHIATMVDCGDVQVLTWSKPGTLSYYVRYVFDYNKVYITGDIGDFIFKVYDKADLLFMSDLDVGYFSDKLTAREGGKYSFDEAQAKEELLSWYKESELKGVIKREIFKELKAVIEESGGIEAYHHYLAMWIENTEYSEFVDYETFSDYGEVYPIRVLGVLTGLKMAYKQLANSYCFNNLRR